MDAIPILLATATPLLDELPVAQRIGLLLLATEAIRALGAKARIVGRSRDDAQAEVERLVIEEGLATLPNAGGSRCSPHTPSRTL